MSSRPGGGGREGGEGRERERDSKNEKKKINRLLQRKSNTQYLSGSHINYPHVHMCINICTDTSTQRNIHIK